jgi:hypothetical protein
MIVHRYELLDLIAEDDERRTYSARDIWNSLNVMVHGFKTQSPSEKKQDLKALSKSLFKGGGIPELLFAGESEGSYYVVTAFREECQDIRKWLEQHASLSAGSPSSEDSLGRAGAWKVPPAPSPSEPGEFTRLFETSTHDAEPALPSGNEARGPARETRPAPPAPPGDFTRMFSAAGTSAEAEEQRGIPETSDQSQQAKGEPGDFTRLFQAAGPINPAPAPDMGARESTGLFQPTSQEKDYSVELTRPAREELETTKTEAGEFTPMFEQRTPPVQKDGISPPAADPAGAWPPVPDTVVPERAANDAATSIFADHAPARLPEIEKPPAGPSDFTRVISAPVISAPVISAPRTPSAETPVPPAQIPTPSPPPPPAPVPATTSYLPVILILNGLFLAALLLVVYFALKN